MLLQAIDGHFAPPADAARAGWLVQHVFAHRGRHDAQKGENSPAAFTAAIKAGLGIECDVRRSREGRAVVFHDADLVRLTGQPGILDQTGIDQISATGLSTGGEPIPTLREVLALVAGRVPLLLELKIDRRQSAATLCGAVRRDLEGYDGHVAVMSFDPRVGRWFARKAPDLLRGLVVTEESRRTFSGLLHRHVSLWVARPQFLAYDIRDLPSAFAARQRARGLPVLTWTVKCRSLLERAGRYADAPIAEGEGLA